MTKAKSHIGLQFSLVNGAGASTNIAITNIATEDTLLLVLEFAQTSNDPTDRTSASSITSAGNIQCTTATDNDKLLVVWNDNSL